MSETPARNDGFTHLDSQGHAYMVDVGDKAETKRVAVAGAFIRMRPETLELIESGSASKGDVMAVARIAGITASKRTADLIPLCHPIPLTSVAVELEPGSGERVGIEIRATAETTGRTGVEMEALTAASVAALTIYDMCKAVDRGMVVEDVRLISKEGGRSGLWVRQEDTK